MKKIILFLFLLLSVLFLGYLMLPGYSFPNPPPDAVQSMEGADTETPLRRSYFTDFTRAQVLYYYQNQINKSSFLNLPMPTLRLNYPPEDAQTLIRDQTHSVYLQEFVHPLRESVYVNGFRYESEDGTWYKGVHYYQKIIIRFVPSGYLPRLVVGFFIMLSIALLYREAKTITKYD